VPPPPSSSLPLPPTSTAPSQPRVPPISLSRSSIRRTASTPAASPTTQPSTVQFEDHEAIRRLLHDRSTPSASPAVHPPPPPAEEPALHRLLERLGVGPGRLMTLDPLRQLQEVAGYGRLEQWWTARESDMTRKGGAGISVYLEGLLLALVLDHRHDPELWVQLAARRLITLQWVAQKVPWDQARAFLPLNTKAGMSADVVNAVLQYASTQQRFKGAYSSSSDSNTSSSFSSDNFSARGGRKGRSSNRTDDGRDRSQSRGREEGRKEGKGGQQGRSAGGNNKNKQGPGSRRQEAETAGADEQ
jgi:hypothetical protein